MPPPSAAPPPQGPQATSSTEKKAQEKSNQAFKVSIKQIDYYTTKPKAGLDICYSPFTGQEARLAPVVRIFGSTPAGQTVCLHLHKILPYLYIKYSRSPEANELDDNIFLGKIAHSIDVALHLSQKPTQSVEKVATLKSRFIHSCALVRGLPFYGYHSNEELFVKIYVYDPKDLNKVATVLLSGAVLGQSFQPYEAHVPYLLKFKTDFNLHGMEYINLSRVLLRDPLADFKFKEEGKSWPSPSAEDAYPVWTKDNVPCEWIQGDVKPKEAHCDIEADSFGEYVLNPSSILQISLQEANQDIRLVPSLAPIWAEERQRNKELGLAFPPRISLSPERRKEQSISLQFRQKHRAVLESAINENLSRREIFTDAAAEASQNSDIDLSLKLTQAANEMKSIDNGGGERKSDMGVTSNELEGKPLRQSQLNTQEVENLLLDTLQWMQENKDNSASLAKDAWEGIAPEDENREAMEDYINLSQKECDDIIQSTLNSVEAGAASSLSNSGGSEEDFREYIPSVGESTEENSESLHSGEIQSLRLELEESDLELSLEKKLSSRGKPEVGNKSGSKCSTSSGQEYLMLFKPITSPPSAGDVAVSMRSLDMPNIVYKQPFFSNPQDVPKSPSHFAGMEFRLKSKCAADLPGFSSNTKSGSKHIQDRRDMIPRYDAMTATHRIHLLASKRLPPSLKEVRLWLSQKTSHLPQRITGLESDMRLDPNSGKLIGDGEADFFSLDSTFPSGSFVVTPSDYCETKPASPKYDEQVPLHLFDSLATPKVDVSRDGGHGSQISPLLIGKEEKESIPSSQAGYRYRKLEETQSTKVSPTVLSLEVFVETRSTFLPDPKYDAVRAVALVYEEQAPKPKFKDSELVLNLLVNGSATPKCFLSSVKRKYALSEDSKYILVENETDLIRMASDRIIQADPDIIMGYEIQSESIGYLKDRLAVLQPEESFLRWISRSPAIPSNSELMVDEYGQLHASGLHSAGRILLNLWRILRFELKLNIYTFQNCVYALLRTRVPYFTPSQLTLWFNVESAQPRCFEHLVERAVLNVRMIECLDLVNRTCELARVYGIDFFSAITRGSQYRVESLLLRLAHTQNYILVSPSKAQVANQSAMECLPLVMEPESRFYTSPVVVLDFQSLYPSMVMAYNLCYSTLVGHVEASAVASSLGVLSKYSAASLLEGQIPLEDLVFSPNGSLFVSRNVKKGVLPRMLQEILDTRQMLKKAMKELPSKEKSLYRLLNSRQFALKLLANVTYGYTAAGFSGRMPCAELADAIVQFGRLTMEKAIKAVESNQKWQAKVVYGDTDSIFVHLPGSSREDAFQIGHEIAAEITSMNPHPVYLKFEKVYHPCILITKKRYVGYAYEKVDQSKPFFDAKGIETIRRDSCPAVSKLLERSLRTVFESKDLSLVKKYLTKQWEKIYRNKISIQDFIFAKEVRLGSYSAKASVVPPAAIVAAKAMALDPRAEPKFAERVPYVVVHGEPGARLVDMVVSPETLIANSTGLRLHETYYISKQIIPALERCFSLLGADVKSWFAQMPKPSRWQPTKRPISALGLSGFTNELLGYRQEAKRTRSTICSFYLSKHCAVCDEMTATDQTICDKCCSFPQATALALQSKTASLERNLIQLNFVCSNCGGGDLKGDIVCNSLDCGVYFSRQKIKQQHKASVILTLSSDDFF